MNPLTQNSAFTTDLLADDHSHQPLTGDSVDIMSQIKTHVEHAEGQETRDISFIVDMPGHSSMPMMDDMHHHEAHVGMMEGHHHDMGGTTGGHTPHADNPQLHGEHMRLLSLVPLPDSHSSVANSFVAVKNGSWFDPKTWAQGKVPGDDSKVFISQGVEVTYDQKSDARIFTLRVDGALEFAKNKNTKLIVDTFVVAPTGYLEIGTEDESIQSNVKTEIIFTSDKAIDTAWDTAQLSRGLLSHGEISIHGAEKLEYASLVGNARAGSTVLTLQEVPVGWRVGDKIVLGGTYYSSNGSDEDNSRFHDEELTINRIVGNRVYFTNDDTGRNTLRYHHTVPEGHEAHDLKLYVANLSRNVSFSTENGKDAPVGHRGHVMFMHNPNVVVEHAGFYDLGRTNKLQPIDAVGTNVDGTEGQGQNVRGRYAFHFHRTGADSWEGQPAIARGNAVSGSPGWGMVHHASYATFEDNVVFDVVGSGIAAEAGNEIGTWHNNLTIKTTGNGDSIIRPDLNERNVLHDFGYEGEGYWVQGASQIAMTDNKAISAAGGGINIFSNAIGGRDFREVSSISVDVLPPALQAIAQRFEMTEIDVANVPLLQLSGFETYNSVTGMLFWQHMGNNDGQLGFNGPGLDPAHDLRALVDDFKIWNVVRDGVHFQYSTQIDLENGLILGNPTRVAGKGISSNRPSQNLNFTGLHVEGFREGFYVPREGDIGDSTPLLGSSLRDSTFVNNRTHLSKRFSRERDPNRTDLFPDYFEIENTTFSTQESNTAPIASFERTVEGGLGVSFDASGSFDPDVAESRDEAMLAIASYGWDFDNDGIVDKFGRNVSHKFESAGNKTVSLTVWDTQGESHSVTQSFDVKEEWFIDAVEDGAFSTATQESITVRSKYQSSLGLALGWTSNGWEIDQSIGNGGAAIAVDPKRAIGQVVYDDMIRVGQQKLSIDIKNIESAALDNQITARVWGVNGQFRHRGWQASGPTAIDALPMNSTLILEESVGGQSFDWTTFQWNADFKQGYEFLIFQVDAEGFESETLDYIAIDNFHVDSDGTPPTVPVLSPTSNSSPVEDLTIKGTSGRDTLAGGPGNDFINGLKRRDVLQGYGGNDKLQGAGGDDTIYGGKGDDTLHGSYGSDHLFGNEDQDFLMGGNANDILSGGAGNDKIHGGKGNDTLTGGTGNDLFRWTLPKEIGDTIIDFDSGEDRLQFKNVALGSDLQRGLIAKEHFSLGSDQASSNTRFLYSNGSLYFDADGNGPQSPLLIADFQNQASLSEKNIQII